jgi:hypothetical protein
MEYLDWRHLPSPTVCFEVLAHPRITAFELSVDRMYQSGRVTSALTRLLIASLSEIAGGMPVGLNLGELSSPALSTSPLAAAVVVGSAAVSGVDSSILCTSDHRILPLPLLVRSELGSWTS